VEPSSGLLVGLLDETGSVESVVANKPLNTSDEDADVLTVVELAELVESKSEAKSAVLALSNKVSDDGSTVLVVEDPEVVELDVPKTVAPVVSLDD